MTQRATATVLLDAVPELGDDLPPDEAEAARRALVAPTVCVEPGPWQPEEAYGTARPAVGLLVVQGLLTRDVALIGRTSTELLGPGDVLRPWEPTTSSAAVPITDSWTVQERTLLAVLDRRVAAAAGRWPEIVGALAQHLVARSRSLSVQLACANLPRLDERLLVLLWHLAERWGRVSPDGVVVPLALTHRMFAKLAGARRPSVTAALGDLHRRGLVVRCQEGWLLQGDPSEPLGALARAREQAPSPV